MTKFQVFVDITMSVELDIDAENEEDAKKKALGIINSEPYYHVRKGTWVCSEIDQVEEIK